MDMFMTTRYSKIKEDFILLSEFAEIRHGPQPILTIPNDAQGEFDISNFSVRVFSTDFQQSSDESFSICPDAQVLLTDLKFGAYAYVHYFALNDIQARGYLRQYCVCYITNSLTKVIDNFEALKSVFSEVTRLFKCGNHRVFAKDLDHRLADIEFSREQIKLLPAEAEENTREYDSQYEDIPENDDSVLKKDFCYISTIMAVFSSEMKKKENQAVYLELEKLNSAHNQQSIYYATGNSKFYTGQETQDTDVVDLPEQEVYKPNRVMSHISQRFTRQLRTLNELSGGASPLAIKAMKDIHQFFSRSEIALNIEHFELPLISPVSSLLSAGRVPLTNMLAHKRNVNSHLLHNHNYSIRTMTSPDNTVEDGNERFSYTVFDNISQPVLSLDTKFINEENLSMTPLYIETIPRLRGLSIVDPLASPPTQITNNKRCQSGLSCLSYSTSDVYVTPGGSPDAAVESNNDDNRHGDGHGSSPNSNNAMEEFASLKGEDEEIVTGKKPVTADGGAVLFLSTSEDEPSSDKAHTSCNASISETTPLISPIKKLGRFPFISSTDLIERPSKHKPGNSLLHCFRDLPELRDIIYSLLIGLPFVIIASPKEMRLVVAHVKALWLFVGGHSSECQVIPWQDSPLTVEQLRTTKLIGLSSNVKIHENLKKHIAYWDWNTNLLVAPKYTGTLLNPILNRTREKKNSEIYLSTVLCILADLACKTFLYYHGFCVRSPQELRQFQKPTPEVSAKKLFAITSQKDKIGFLSNVRVKDSDIDIIEYWMEIIRRQQLKEWQTHCRLSHTPNQGSQRTMRLTMKHCTEKLCKPKRVSTTS